MTRPRATARKTRAGSQPLQVRLTHPDRVIFDDPEITKQDLAIYYNQVSERLLARGVDGSMRANIMRYSVSPNLRDHTSIFVT